MTMCVACAGLPGDAVRQEATLYISQPQLAAVPRTTGRGLPEQVWLLQPFPDLVLQQQPSLSWSPLIVSFVVGWLVFQVALASYLQVFTLFVH